MINDGSTTYTCWNLYLLMQTKKSTKLGLRYFTIHDMRLSSHAMSTLMQEEAAYVALKTSVGNSNRIKQYLSINSHLASLVEPFCLFIELTDATRSQTT